MHREISPHCRASLHSLELNEGYDQHTVSLLSPSIPISLLTKVVYRLDENYPLDNHGYAHSIGRYI